MSTPIPTGHLEKHASGLDLILARTLPIGIREAWTAITEPDQTARWIGRWEGNGVQGQSVKLQMGFEEGSAWSNVAITECRAPKFLRVQTVDDFGSWDLSVELHAGAQATELRFVHHGLAPGSVGDIGPGWEYYLDQLIASITGEPFPVWDDYYPAQKEFFQDQEN